MILETVRPRDYNDVRHVGQYFREGIPVVMDLTAVADDEARQFVDFAAGLICGRRGDMERLSPKIFLLIPSGSTKPNVAAIKAEAPPSESF
ncbi:cell division protein SepF [Streptosporangium sp. NPDC006013]|uniref:cell division protein SepF n=1 Tax=Streptosporangium sp. NPDC006013 TaxID=3155596 RepID=UPI0033A18B48